MPRPDNGPRLTDTPRWIRARCRGKLVIDCRRAKLLYGRGPVPTYAFPREDVMGGALVPSDRAEPVSVGRARYLHLEVGGRRVPDAAWTCTDPAPDAPEGLASLVVFRWDALDAWFEEEEQVYVHPRDPWHRVDALASSRHVRVELEGTVLGETRRPVLVFETGLPARFYFPPLDVAAEHLSASETVTRCPYKGEAAYLSAEIAAHIAEDVAWRYRHPTPAVAAVAGHVAFHDEKLNVWVDGEKLPRKR